MTSIYSNIIQKMHNYFIQCVSDIDKIDNIKGKI